MALVIRRAKGNDGTEKFYVVDSRKPFTRDGARAVFSDYDGAADYIKLTKRKKSLF